MISLTKQINIRNISLSQLAAYYYTIQIHKITKSIIHHNFLMGNLAVVPILLNEAIVYFFIIECNNISSTYSLSHFNQYSLGTCQKSKKPPCRVCK